MCAALWRRSLAGAALLLVNFGAANPVRGAPASAEVWQYQAHLITIGAGPTLTERLGRSLLTVGRVRPGRLENVVYDLGFPEGVPGLLDYLSGSARLSVLRVGTVTRALERFRNTGRSIHVQRLRLRRDEIDRLRAALVAELDPSRQVYRSHPLGESSATRARDLIDAATGGALRRGLDGGKASSPRELLRTNLAGRPGGELLLDLFGGRALDRPLDGYRALFLPEGLARALPRARREGTALSDPPSPLHRVPLGPARPWHPAQKLACFWAALLLGTGLLALWRARRSVGPAGLWLLGSAVLPGAIGLVQALLALASKSPEVRSNELLLSFLCTDLFLLPVAWRWLRGAAAAGRLLLGYAGLRAGLVLAVLLGHATGILFQQPRALLLPSTVSAALLLSLVLRVRGASAPLR